MGGDSSISEIKNKTIEEKLKEATHDDAIMQAFLLAVVGNEYKTTQYNKVYKAEIEKAIKAKGGIN